MRSNAESPPRAADSPLSGHPEAHPETHSETSLEKDVPIRSTPLLETLLAGELGFPRDLSRSIHGGDEMLRYLVELNGGDHDRAVASYFLTGLQAFQMTDQVVRWRFGDWDRVRMLDFASGYGRVTRFLLAHLDPSRLTVSDVMPEAVAYQRRTFGVEAAVSATDPRALELPGTYDLVQAISLFSHLPEKLFRRWLVELWSRVEKGGVLIFSTHGAQLLPEAARRDFVFVPSSENRELDPEAYGSTWVTERFVARVLDQELSDFSYRRLPRGLCGYQDVYVVVRDGSVDARTLDYDAGVGGHIDVAKTTPGGRLEIAGWAASISPERSVEAVDFVLGDRVLASAELGLSRPDIAHHFGEERLGHTGWSLTVDLPPTVSFSQDAAMILARTETSVTPLALGCIYSLLADTARANLEFLQNR